MAMIVINQDIESIRQGPFKIKQPYLDRLEQMLNLATKERRTLRQSMRRHKVKVVLLEKDELFSTFLFMGNRREEKRNYFNPTIKKKVETIFEDLLQKTHEAKENDPLEN